MIDIGKYIMTYAYYRSIAIIKFYFLFTNNKRIKTYAVHAYPYELLFHNSTVLVVLLVRTSLRVLRFIPT